eukprot:907739-Rhodomonas_salina.7
MWLLGRGGQREDTLAMWAARNDKKEAVNSGASDPAQGEPDNGRQGEREAPTSSEEELVTHSEKRREGRWMLVMLNRGTRLTALWC